MCREVQRERGRRAGTESDRGARWSSHIQFVRILQPLNLPVLPDTPRKVHISLLRIDHPLPNHLHPLIHFVGILHTQKHLLVTATSLLSIGKSFAPFFDSINILHSHPQCNASTCARPIALQWFVPDCSMCLVPCSGAT